MICRSFTRQVLVNNFQKLVDKIYPANAYLRMGQIMWLAVDANKTHLWKNHRQNKDQAGFY